MANKNGGPAFPTDEYYDNQKVGVHFGMTLRDYFAAKAMQARLSDYESCKSIKENIKGFKVTFAQEVAAQAYDMADAMIAERSK